MYILIKKTSKRNRCQKKIQSRHPPPRHTIALSGILWRFFSPMSAVSKIDPEEEVAVSLLIALSNRYWTGTVTYSNLIESTAPPGQTVGRVTLAKFQLHALPVCKGPGKQGHTVADTNVSLFARAHNICCRHKFCVWHTKMFLILFRNILSATNVSQFAQPKKHHGQQCVLVYQGLAMVC